MPYYLVKHKTVSGSDTDYLISRDSVLWLQCWRSRRTDFNQKPVKQLLARFWPSLDLAVFATPCAARVRT
ncbi:MAG: hypothetical protein PHY54_01715 [Methylococcales bacterium]|nr:hypothetical protein [Methylococcales bacterium]